MRTHILPRRRFLAAPLTAAASAAVLAHTRAAAGERQAPRKLQHPGFLDLQVNGFAGVDFNDPATPADRVHDAIAAMRKSGVTQMLPTLISAPLDRFTRCAQTLVSVKSPAIPGFHMEGPYISPEDGARGAHRRQDVSPASIDDFKRRQEALDGRVRLLTIAPEVPGALQLIEYLRRNGVHVSIGHTAASPAQIRDGIAAGATLSTHLGNGCAQMLPRHPNFIWEQLAADELLACFIVDGHHLPPATVKSMVRAKTPSRTILVTDATIAAGQPPGLYKFGELTVRLDENGRVAIPGSPYLAGSALSLDRAVGNVVRFSGVSLDEALTMASTRPAEYLGVAPRGTLDLEWDPGPSTLRVVAVQD